MFSQLNKTLEIILFSYVFKDKNYNIYTDNKNVNLSHLKQKFFPFSETDLFYCGQHLNQNQSC